MPKKPTKTPEEIEELKKLHAAKNAKKNKDKAPKEKKKWPQLCANLMINEIMPRKNNNGLSYDDFPIMFLSILARLLFEEKITRHEYRKFLDDHVEWVLQGRPRDEEEDKEFVKYLESKM